MTNEQKNEVRKILKHFGYADQLVKDTEEVYEYMQAKISFSEHDSQENLDNLIYEYVDKMITGLQVLYGSAVMVGMTNKEGVQYVDTVIENATNYKLKRTLERIDSRYYEGDK